MIPSAKCDLVLSLVSEALESISGTLLVKSNDLRDLYGGEVHTSAKAHARGIYSPGKVTFCA